MTDKMQVSSLKLKNSFTLIELLVVVAIISVLIALLLPSLSAARESAKQVVCSTHLQQMGVFFGMYSNDNSDWLCPPDENFITKSGNDIPYPVLMRQYLNDPELRYDLWSGISGNFRGGSGGILECPSNPNKMYYAMCPHYGMNSFPWVYYNNNSYYSSFSPVWKTLGMVKEPSKVIYLMETDSRDWISPPQYYSYRVSNNIISWGRWHGAKKNMTDSLMFDGHVKTWDANVLYNVYSQTLDEIMNAPWYAK